MSKFLFLSRRCPVCGCTSVSKIPLMLHLSSKCSICSTKFELSFFWGMIYAWFEVLFLMFCAMLLLNKNYLLLPILFLIYILVLFVKSSVLALISNKSSDEQTNNLE